MGQIFGGEVTILFYYDYQEWYYKHKLFKLCKTVNIWWNTREVL